MSDSLTQVSALERLRALPEVFVAADLQVVAGVSAEVAAVMLHRWARRGHVQRLAARSDVYANVVRGASVASHREQMLVRAMPGALVVGWSALLDAGWTTQRPHAMELAVCRDARGSRLEVDGVVQRAYARSVITRISEGAIISERVHAGKQLPRLAPAWALAFWADHSPLTLPAPDDLDIPDIAKASLLEAAQRLSGAGLPLDGATAEEIYETWFEARHEQTPARRASRAAP